MKVHNNATIDNAADLDYPELLEAVKTELENRNITGETNGIIADLMIRYDQNVIEDNGQFYPASEYPPED